jgi:oligopeptide/dipeptide ABC transporter ATP-binding protein
MSAMSILRLLPAEVTITSGEILFAGDDLVSLPSESLRQIRGRDIGVVFQDPMTALNPLHRIGKQVSEAPRLHGATDEKRLRAGAIGILDRVGIPHSERRLKNRPFEFSGGMRQRVLIAEALSCGPKILIADEPTTGLDVTIQVQILELLDRMRRENEMGIILISHDLTMIARVCDHLIVMYAGRVIESGPTAEVLRNPLHPYTLALASATPTLASVPGEPLPALPGSPPPMSSLGVGCSFAPRCAFAEEACWRAEPELDTVGGPRRRSACWVAQRDGSLGGKSQK